MIHARPSRMRVVDDIRSGPVHIAMFNIPRHGHVIPSLAVIRELVDRGHRVTYSINEEFAPQVAAAGGTPVLYQATPFSKPNPTLPTASHKDPISGVTMFPPVPAAKWLDEAMSVLPQMRVAYDRDRPDLLLFDIASYAAPVLAAEWGIPIIQLSPTYVAWEGYEEGIPVFQTMRADPAGAAYYARFAAWLSGHGLSISPEEFVLHPQRSIVLIPRFLQPHEAKVPNTYTFVGPCFGDRSFQGNWQPPKDGRPILLISLGSVGIAQAEFYRECITAFADQEWHVVMAIGRYIRPNELGQVPNNIEVHQWVSQFSILSQADTFITHAGPAGICEALYHGVPLVAVPQAWDQFRYAARIVELGIGQYLSYEQATAATLREAVLTLASDPRIQTRLNKIQKKMLRYHGTTTAANLIEQHLKTT
jgi:macrolide glycosyltransferase